MNRKVNSVQALHDDAYGLYNNVVIGGGDYSADTIIANLASGIQILKGCWEGKDAGVQIENIVKVHNAMVGIRNSLAALATESSKIAANYREIQNSNGAGLEAFGAISCENKTIMEDYTDTRDSVGITPEASNGKAKIDAANGSIDSFISEVKKYYNSIMENWTAGTGRENAQESFDTFISNSNVYKETLATASASITTAIQNYTF